MVDPADTARNRFLIISLVRVVGAVLLLAGMVIAYGRMASVPPKAGIPVALIGAFCFAVAPRLLARRWRSPE